MKIPSFGDHVRIRPTPATTSVGAANKMGIVYGMTTPSITGVEVLGPATGDRAVNVKLDGDERQFWFPVDALEILDYSPGITAKIGKTNLIRGRDGRWQKLKPS